MADGQDRSPCFGVKRMPTSFPNHPSAFAVSHGHSEHDASYAFPAYTPSCFPPHSAIRDSLRLLFLALPTPHHDHLCIYPDPHLFCAETRGFSFLHPSFQHNLPGSRRKLSKPTWDHLPRHCSHPPTEGSATHRRLSARETGLHHGNKQWQDS